jgi:CrcB protein
MRFLRDYASNPLVLIASGGFAGAVLRAVCSELVGGVSGTLVVNVTGSFVLGFLMYSVEFGGFFSREVRLMVGIGFCGSLTTFSTLMFHSFNLSAAGFAVNIVLNVALGLLSVFAGRGVSIFLAGRRAGWS